MKLTSKLRIGALAAGLVAALGTSGCTNRELVRIGDSPPFVFMPRLLEPGVIRDARENEQATDAEYRSRQNQGGIMVTTPQGYQINLDVYDKVMYGREKYSIHEINPPKITIIPLIDIGNNLMGYDPKYKFNVKISELDMMQN